MENHLRILQPAFLRVQQFAMDKAEAFRSQQRRQVFVLQLWIVIIGKGIDAGY